ncbi:hypothetical protein PC116_g26843 [Phytophthora cactorum]|uniref:Uncharacterized protein n=1 Tax=Phytophthora cactorum TaxID=29920 RepID=A0A8T1JNX4_9STRA|nr:hypothetical protein PC111_g22233 [Phytophthora cactorum]KAG2795558.1 hypothetical protein PC112_g22588 [Phytophthora cactorum]KAG2821506.1 hypothetical protein PC113_g22469 [Phytophthora cactorum]KAG2874515.1 hypothetical protein PC114_g25233 [Phytophthora cactorum]KAG3140952.1 hypothetical protein PC128_g25081 [Phytophthora cactorum]
MLSSLILAPSLAAAKPKISVLIAASSALEVWTALTAFVSAALSFVSQ